jgi:small subunit ribosomal protein S1
MDQEATETTSAPEPSTDGSAEQTPGVPTVIMHDPGGDMTSTGEPIVENEYADDDAFEAALESTLKPLNDGDIVEGVVVKVDPDEALVDIGYKSEGVIPARELSIKQDIDPREVVQVGDVIEALVVTKEDQDGRLILSKKRAQYERAWGTIERIFSEDGTVVGTVIEVVKGGLILDIGLRGFLPASLVEMRRVRDLHPYVSEQLECKIIELDKNRNNVVLSRRKFLEETQSEFRQEFLGSLRKGEIRKGVVSSIVNFGAFVDLGGVDGLVHVSELSWHHIDHPSEIVEVGDEVNVEVLDVDLERERVSLSLKATQEDPWTKFSRENDTSDVVEGEVTKLVPFGAFVKVEEGIEGLIHISELAEHHVEAPEAVVNVGDRIEVKVIDIDTVRRRISLSLRQVASDTPPAGAPGRPDQPLTPEQIALAETAYVSGGRDEPAASSSIGDQLRQAGLAHSEDPSEAGTEEPAAAPEAEAGEPSLEGELAGQATGSEEERAAEPEGTVGAADVSEIDAEVPEQADEGAPEAEAAPARAVAQADEATAEEVATEEVGADEVPPPAEDTSDDPADEEEPQG